MAELIVLMGLQGSGKSTFYRQYFAHSHTLVSKDLFPNNRNKPRRQNQLLEEAFKLGQSVVLDNTNATRAEREDAIALAKNYGLSVKGYVFICTVEQAKARNSQRTGKARVPDVGIYATAAKWEYPELNEGFAELCQVLNTEDDGFKVMCLHEQ